MDESTKKKNQKKSSIMSADLYVTFAILLYLFFFGFILLVLNIKESDGDNY